MRFKLLSLLILFSNFVFSFEYNIRTKQTGFYQISKSEIDKLGFEEKQIKLSDLTLTNAGGEQPFFFSSKETELTNENNLVFFAEALTGEISKQHPLDDDNGFKLSKSSDAKEILSYIRSS